MGTRVATRSRLGTSPVWSESIFYVDVEADDVVSDFSEARSGHEPDVADAEDGDVPRKYGARCRSGSRAVGGGSPSSRDGSGKSGKAGSSKLRAAAASAAAATVEGAKIVGSRHRSASAALASDKRKDGVGQARDTRRRPARGPLWTRRCGLPRRAFAKAKSGLAEPGRFTQLWRIRS